MRFVILKLKAVLYQEQNHHTCIVLGILGAGSESWDYLRLIWRGSDNKLVSCHVWSGGLTWGNYLSHSKVSLPHQHKLTHLSTI